MKTKTSAMTRTAMPMVRTAVQNDDGSFASAASALSIAAVSGSVERNHRSLLSLADNEGATAVAAIGAGVS